MLAQLADPDRAVLPDELSDLRAPALVIAGRDAPIFPPVVLSTIAGLLPVARVEIMDSGHSPYFEVPSEFNALVRSFIDNV